MKTATSHNITIKEWFIAASRPKTLATAIIPFLTGTFLVKAQGKPIEWTLLFFCWLSAICIQIATNITNDAYDFKRGTDHEGVLGPQRATRAGMLAGTLSFNQVLMVGIGFFGAALLFGIPLMLHGGWIVAAVLICSVLAGFLYTGGPYPLAYHGLGDLFVMLFYGGVATNSAYWLQTGEITAYSLLLSLQVGCLCTSMIAINNLRDVVDDARSSKRTLPVRFGVLFGKGEIAVLLIMPLILNLFWPWTVAAWLPLLSAPLAFAIIRKVVATEPSREYNKYLPMAGANMLAFCILLVIGFYFV